MLFGCFALKYKCKAPGLGLRMVNATYGVAVGYVASDVAYRVYQAEEAGADAAEMQRVATHATIFHSARLLSSQGFYMPSHHTRRALFGNSDTST